MSAVSLSAGQQDDWTAMPDATAGTQPTSNPRQMTSVWVQPHAVAGHSKSSTECTVY
jgi:hypothetical protein